MENNQVEVDSYLEFEEIDISKLPKHKYTAKEMGRYYDLLAKPFSEMNQAELEFVEKMEKATIEYWQEYKNWSYDKAYKYVLDNRNRIIDEHMHS